MANSPMPPKQPTPSSATILQKLLDQQIETNRLLQKSITLQQEKNKKIDVIVDAALSILKLIKNINNEFPLRIPLGFLVVSVILFTIHYYFIRLIPF